MGIPGLIPGSTQGAVYQALSLYPVCAIEVEILHDEPACHGPAKHGSIFYFQIVQQFLDVLAVPGNGMALQALGGIALASGVKADQAMGLGQSFQIVFEEPGVAAEAGNQYDGAAFFGAVVFEVKDCVVTCAEVVISCSCHMGAPFYCAQTAVPSEKCLNSLDCYTCFLCKLQVPFGISQQKGY